VTIPTFNRLRGEKEFIINVEDIINKLDEDDKKEMEDVYSSEGRRKWRSKKEQTILHLLKMGKTMDEINNYFPPILALNRNNTISISDGFTRIKVSRNLGIKTIKVIIGKGI